MIGGIYESPLAMRAFLKWRDEVDDGTMLLRDIIDLETTYARINGGANEPDIANDNIDKIKFDDLNVVLKTNPKNSLERPMMKKLMMRRLMMKMKTDSKTTLKMKKLIFPSLLWKQK